MKFAIFLLALLSFEAGASSCAQDAKKHCPGVSPGKGQLAKCLSDYETLLSTDCAKELKQFKKDTAKKNPCFEDLADLCLDIPAEGPKIEYCLIKNESKLSEACAEDFKKKKGNILVRNVCAQDVVNHCYSTVTESDAALNHCLIKNRDKLAKFCQSSVDKRIANIKKNNPCFDDQMKHCSDKVKFVEIQDCLEKKIPSLAPTCKKVVENEVKKTQANPCYRDLVTHCVPNLNPKQQMECLNLNEEHLSRSCLDYRKKEQDKIKKMVDACEEDRLKFCAKEPFENGRVARCLVKNKAKLQKKCSELL